MKLYEPFTFILITVLIFAFSGSLGKMFWNGSKADCHERNTQLMSDQRYGPLAHC